MLLERRRLSDDQDHILHGSHGVLMPYGRNVTNAVLLEKLNNQAARLAEQADRLDKIDIKLTQNFESVSSVLKEGYVHKTEFQHLKERLQHIEEVEIPKIYEEMSHRLHKDAFAPYSWAAKILGSAGLLGTASLAWKIVSDYIQGGAPK